VKAKFEQILTRISIIDRDVNELNRIKSKLPDDRPYSSGLQLIFDKQINNLLDERDILLGQTVPNPPAWLVGDITNGHHKHEVIQTIPTIDPNYKNTEPTEQEVMAFIKALPKTEIHLHLEACVNKPTLKEMFKKNGIRFIVLGDFSAFPASVRHSLKRMVDIVLDREQIKLNVALNYGGRDEIVSAIKKIVKSGIKADKIDEELVSKYLYTHDQPDPNDVRVADIHR